MDKNCFIICPIGNEETETRKRTNIVFDYFLKPVCENMGYNIIRADQIANSEKIDSDIIKYLDTSELVIADLSELNPNVFYEIGYRKAKGLPCIHIAQEGTILPFDVTTVRTQFYSISDIPKYESFKESLTNVISTIESRNKNSDQNSNIEVEEENSSVEQEILDRMYNLEDSIQSFYDMISNALMDIDKHIDDCCQGTQPKDQFEQIAVESFMKEAMKNPANAKRFITLFQNLENGSKT